VNKHETSKGSLTALTVAALLGANALKPADTYAAHAAMPNRIVHIDKGLGADINPNNSTENGPIALRNFEPLYHVLLPEQFNAVYYDLSLFLQDKVDPSIHEASLGHLNDARDGTLSFMVTALSGHQLVSFEEIINRRIWDKVAINIPKYHYQKTIKVY